MFSKKPGVYITRDRKLPLHKVISRLLSMEARSLTSELCTTLTVLRILHHPSLSCSKEEKISEAAFPTLFSLFVQKTDSPSLYKGLRLLAADGSDIQIPTNLSHPESFYPGTNGQAPYSLLHLDVV